MTIYNLITENMNQIETLYTFYLTYGKILIGIGLGPIIYNVADKITEKIFN